jgi:hypothetical protein
LISEEDDPSQKEDDFPDEELPHGKDSGKEPGPD